MNIQEVADLIGEEESKIEEFEIDAARLMERGVLVDVDVRGASMFTTMASYEDLGLPATALIHERINRGSKNLIPKVYLRRIASLSVRLHKTLERHSVSLSVFHPYRYVPYTAWTAFRQEWERLSYDWDVLRAEILENYEMFYDQAAAQFQEIARDAWRALVARYARQGKDYAVDENIFVDRVTAAALSAFPTRERIASGFIVGYRVAILRPAFTTTFATIDLDVGDDEALHVQREARRLARRQMAALGSPLRELFDKVRTVIYEDARELADGLRKHGRLVGRMAERAENLTKIFRLLNAHGDLELEEAIVQLEAIVATRKHAGGGVDAAALESVLGEIVNLTHASVAAERERTELARRAAAIEL